MLTAVQVRQMVLPVADKYRRLERHCRWLQPFKVDHRYRLHQESYNTALGFLVCGRPRINYDRDQVAGNTTENIDLNILGTTCHNPLAADTRAAFTSIGSALRHNSGWYFFMDGIRLLDRRLRPAKISSDPIDITSNSYHTAHIYLHFLLISVLLL